MQCNDCGCIAQPNDGRNWGTKCGCVDTDLAILRKALVGLIGTDDKAELEQIESAIRSSPAPDEDKASTINAIHALQKTRPKHAT